MVPEHALARKKRYCQYCMAAAIGTMIDHQDEKFHYSPKELLAYGKNYRY